MTQWFKYFRNKTFCSRRGVNLLNTIMKLGLKKSVKKQLLHHCFAWKSLHEICIQTSVWRVNIFLTQLPKISLSLSIKLHSILCLFTLIWNKTLLADSRFIIYVHIHCLFPIVVIFLFVCILAKPIWINYQVLLFVFLVWKRFI